MTGVARRCAPHGDCRESEMTGDAGGISVSGEETPSEVARSVVQHKIDVRHPRSPISRTVGRTLKSIDDSVYWMDRPAKRDKCNVLEVPMFFAAKRQQGGGGETITSCENRRQMVQAAEDAPHATSATEIATLSNAICAQEERTTSERVAHGMYFQPPSTRARGARGAACLVMPFCGEKFSCP